MGVMYSQYKKAARAKAKEYLRNKRGYKTREEKKAFRIAEKYRVNQWKNSLQYLDEQERRRQLEAFRYYNIQKNLLKLLAVFVLLLLAVAVTLLIML